MVTDAIALKKRIDNLLICLSSGQFTDSTKSDFNGCLEALESLKVDKELLQTTRIGSSLTKLSKSLDNHCKESSNKIINIIERWKSQLRSTIGTNPTKRQKTLDGANSAVNLPVKVNTAGFGDPSFSNSLSKNFGSSGQDLTSVNRSKHVQSKLLTSSLYDTHSTDLTSRGSLGNAIGGGSVGHPKDPTTTSSSTTGSDDSNKNNHSVTTTAKLNEGAGGLSLSFSSENVSDLNREGNKEDELDLPSYSGVLHKDLVRDKALRYLFRCFLIGQDFGPELNKLNELIYDIEKALYDHYVISKNTQKEYNLQLKCISFNFKDIKNTFFNYKVYSGLIPVSELVTMSSLQMASDEKKLERSEILEQSLEACQSDWAIKNIFLNQKSKGQFKCGKCNSRQTTYYQLQTRSSDEPMTTFVTCLNCKNRWRF